MKGKFIHLFVVCIALFLSISLQAQDYLYNVQQWELEDGLLHRLVHVVHEDQTGFIWIGTENGVQRFDGHEFKSYESGDPQKSTVRITKIGEDDGNWLWLWDKSRDEFSFLNTVTEKMESESEHFGADFPIRSMTKSGRWIYNEEHIQQTSDGRLVFVLSNPGEIVTYDSKNSFRSTRLDFTGGAVLRYVDQDDNLWISTNKKSVTKVSMSGKVLHHFALPQFESLGSFNTLNNEVYFTCSFSEGKQGYKVTSDLLLVSRELDASKEYFGKYNWHLIDDAWQAYAGDSLRIEVPAKKYKKCLYASIADVVEDSKGRFWVASGYGLSVIVSRKGNFKKILTSRTAESNGNAYSVRGITEYKDNITAHVEQVALIGGGVNGFGAIPSTNVGIPLLVSSKGVLVSGVVNGLEFLGKDGLVNRVLSKSTDKKIVPWSLSESQAGIWLGTDAGLYFYDNTTKAIDHISFTWSIDNRWEGFKEIYSIYKVSEEELWLCTATGFYVVDPKTRVVKARWNKESATHYLPLDIAYHQHLDSDGILWLATNNGLVRWRLKTSNFQVFNQQAGFSNNTIYAVYEDAYDYLWMSSDYGIIRFHKETELVSSYVTKHGISHNEFNRVSHYQGIDGTIYLGGLDGITSFHPADFLVSNTNVSPLLLSDFSVYNGANGLVESKVGEARTQQEVDILPEYRYVNLKLAMPTYEDDNLNKYAWKIEGLDADWQIQKDNKLQLGKLPYGSHILLVKAANSGTGWGKNQLQIKLNVLKPFYLQSWFIALLVGLILLGVILFFQYKTRELKANELKLQAKVAEATETIQQDKELIQQQADDLQEMDMVKSRFFTNVSHELRTPLTLILGPLEQLLSREDTPLPSHIESKLKLSLSNSLKLKSRVDELLDLSKLDGKELKLNLAPVDVHVVLKSAIDAFCPIAKNQGVQIEVSGIKNNEPYALVDEERVVKVVDNLLSNALKHSPVKGKIFVDLSSQESSYLVRISDQGMGVKEEEQEAIFKRFYQTTQGEAVGGTGIGLSLSKNIAELMGGSLSLDRDYSEGASFVFAFEANRGVDKKSIEKIEEGEPSVEIVSTSLLPTKKLNVLLVEDNVELRSYVRSIVEGDYFIYECGDGLAALELLDSQQIDIIISDIMMPNMDGITFVSELKKSGREKTPIIMLSAKSTQTDIVSMLEMGVDDYVVKPFYARELLARLHNQARNLAVRQEAAIGNEVEDKTSYSKKWLTELKELTVKNLSNVNFSVVDVVKALNQSERTLNRNLNKELGLSCAAYIKELRLQTAQSYLQANIYSSVKEVSTAVGFKRQDYFTKEFYKRYGKYPSEY